jgi:hypothetical protein
MATSTKTHNPSASFDTAFEQFKDSSEQFVSYARRAGNAYLDSYEKAVDRAIELELKVADTTQQEWLKSIIETQTDFARELSSSYTTAARSLLK